MKSNKSISMMAILSALALASCADPIASSVVSSSEAITSSASPSSSVVSSDEPNRLLVSDMMSDLELGNFTYTMTFGDIDVYFYRVDIPLLEVTIVDPETNFATSLFLDLTNEEAPVLYIQQEDESWLVSPADPFLLMSILFPLQLINPESMEDDWFTWNDAEQAYILLEAYYTNVFGEDLEGTEYFQISQLPNGDIQIMMQGRSSIEDPLDTILLTYSDIGTTEVKLPEVTIDFPTFIMNDVLPNTTNHRFNLTMSALDDLGEPSETLLSVIGERSDDTFSSTSIENINVTTKYVTQTTEGPLMITLNGSEYIETDLLQEEYIEALQQFYPVPMLDLQPEWLDLTQPLVVESEGLVAYPLQEDAVDTFLANLLPDGSLHESTLIYFVNSPWMGPLVASETTFTLDGIMYEAFFLLGSFNQVETIHPPFDPGETLSLSEILDLIQLTQNYSLFQVERDEDYSTLAIQSLSRDGNQYEYQDLANGYYPVYFEVLEDSVSQWAYDAVINDYQESTLTTAEFDDALTTMKWFHPEVLTEASFFLPDPDFLNSYTLDPSLHSALIAQPIQTRLTIDSISLYVASFGEPTLYFTVYATDKNSNLPITLDITLEDIGSTEILFPHDGEQSLNYVDFSTFSAYHSEGIESFLGTMERYDETDTLVEEHYFGRQGSLVAFVDPNLYEFQVFTENDTQTGYVQIQGSVGSALTQTTPIDEAVYNEQFALANVLQFNTLQESDLLFFDETTPLDGDYRLASPAASSFLTQGIEEGETINDVRLQLTLDMVIVTIELTNTNNNTTATLIVTYEAINEDVDILSFLTA